MMNIRVQYLCCYGCIATNITSRSYLIACVHKKTTIEKTRFPSFGKSTLEVSRSSREMAVSEFGRFEEGRRITKQTQELWKATKKETTVKHSLTRVYGCPNVGDSVLSVYSNIVNPVPGHFQSERIICPPIRSIPRYTKITGIIVIDLTADGKGGETKFVRGVVPGDYAEIEISSHICAGYSVKVIITGRS